MSATGTDVWYRNPLVWMMIAFPAWSVIAGISTVVVAFQVFDGVVVDDYYARGKAINVVIERDVAALRRGLAAVVHLAPARSAAGTEVTAAVTALDVGSLPAVLKLALLHSTRGGVDAHVDLVRTAPGAYRADLPALAPGKYYLQVEAEDWRIVGALRQPAETTTSLGPAQ